MTPERGTWDITYWSPTAPGAPSNRYSADGISVRAGSTTTRTFDGAALAPPSTEARRTR
ncbi:hypothetical protein ABZ543_07515 [Streptomyces roseifaciens]